MSGWRVLIMVGVLAGAHALAGAAGPPPGPSAGPAAGQSADKLPIVNLSVEARVVEVSEAERQAMAAGGSVGVGTGGATTVQGGVTLRAGSDQASTRQVQRVLVLNGGRATLRLSQLVPLRSVSLTWSGVTVGTTERTRWIDVGSGLVVQPRWRGGSAPVLADVEVDSQASPDPTAERTRVQTQLSFSLGQWVTVAELGQRSEAASVGGGWSVSSSASSQWRSLQMRVTAP